MWSKTEQIDESLTMFYC